jgi:hypothetical protein
MVRGEPRSGRHTLPPRPPRSACAIVPGEPRPGKSHALLRCSSPRPPVGRDVAGRPEAVVPCPRLRDQAREQLGEGDVRRDRELLGIPFGRQQRVPEGPVGQPDVGEQAAVAVPGLDVAGQADRGAAEPALGERRCLLPVPLHRPSRRDRLGRVHADHPDRVAPPADHRHKGVAVDHPLHHRRDRVRRRPRPRGPLGGRRAQRRRRLRAGPVAPAEQDDEGGGDGQHRSRAWMPGSDGPLLLGVSVAPAPTGCGSPRSRRPASAGWPRTCLPSGACGWPRTYPPPLTPASARPQPPGPASFRPRVLGPVPARRQAPGLWTARSRRRARRLGCGA